MTECVRDGVEHLVLGGWCVLCEQRFTPEDINQMIEARSE